MPSPSQEQFFGTGGHHAGLVEAVLAALVVAEMSGRGLQHTPFNPNHSQV